MAMTAHLRRIGSGRPGISPLLYALRSMFLRQGEALCRIVLVLFTITGGVSVARAGAGLGLHVHGNQLYDGAVPLTLRGVNRSSTEYACVQGPDVIEGPADATAVRAVASWGLNAIRVPLNEDCWLGINGVAIGGAAYQRAVMNWVATITSAGLYAIVDLHWSAPANNQAVGQEPMPDQDHAPAFWTGVAQAFKQDPRVLFDLFNEPDPVPYTPYDAHAFGHWQNADFACLRDGCTVLSTQGVPYQAAGMQELLDAVRGTGATNVVLVGGIQDAQTITQYQGDADQPFSYLPHDVFGNLAISTHIYPADACGDEACWNETIAPVATHYPVVVTEFGDTTCTATLTQALLPWLDSHGIGYLAWNWGTSAGCQDLISDYQGTPTTPYGTAYKQYLATVHGS